MDLQQNTGRGPRRRGTGQKFKQHVDVAFYCIQRMTGSLAPNVYVRFDSEDMPWFLGKLCWHYRRQNLLVIWQGRPLGL